MRDAGQRGPDFGDWWLSVGVGDREERLVPTTVHGRFFVAEGEVVEEVRRVGVAFIFAFCG